MENKNFLNRIEGSLIIRLVMAFVFFYFGFAQLTDATSWTSYLPSFVSIIPISATKFVLLNGWFEVVSAVLLILGAYTRLVAFLLSLHLFGIAFSIGMNGVGVRDIGLAGTMLALVFSGAGKMSVDEFVDVETGKIV